MNLAPDEPDYRRWLKKIVKGSVRKAGQEALASISTRIQRAAAFSDYGNTELPDRHMPIDVAIEVDAYNGDQRIIEAMARLLGCIVVKLPASSLLGSKLGKLTGDAMREVGDVFSKLGEILDDRKITLAELGEFEREADEAIARIVALKLQVKAETEGLSDE